MDKNNLLEVRNLCTYFFTDKGIVKAVDGLDFDLKRNSVLGIVGESGSGKSVTSLAIMDLLRGTTGREFTGQTPGKLRSWGSTPHSTSPGTRIWCLRSTT